MSTLGAINNGPASDPKAERVDMKFEVTVIPVTDVDRSKAFYTKLGWRLDADYSFDNGFRMVQFTPPGSVLRAVRHEDDNGNLTVNAEGLTGCLDGAVYRLGSSRHATRDDQPNRNRSGCPVKSDSTQESCHLPALPT